MIGSSGGAGWWLVVAVSEVNASQFAQSLVQVADVPLRGATSQRQTVESSGKQRYDYLLLRYDRHGMQLRLRLTGRNWPIQLNTPTALAIASSLITHSNRQ